MEELVRVIKNEVFTDSMVVAQGTGNEHHSVTRIIRNYIEDFKEFGEIQFMDLKSINPQGGRPIRIYLLNEQQATLLMTYLGNNEIVRSFKKKLVQQFYQMKKSLIQKQSIQWQQTRLAAKNTRKLETEEIKELVQYAHAQGSKSAEKYYLALSKLANKTIGLSGGQREQASITQLNTLALVENIIHHVIQEGIEEQVPYKDIYKMCKARLEQFKEITYLG